MTDSQKDKPLVWLSGEVKTPPFSTEARIETGVLLRQLQQGELIPMPHSRQMSSIGSNCHELRIVDKDKTWRNYLPNRSRLHSNFRCICEKNPTNSEVCY